MVYLAQGLQNVSTRFREVGRDLHKACQSVLLVYLAQGAPLDNNLVERALKKAILHRKNLLFYKTLNGAEVGDLYMSLIHTCELNAVNPLDYLTELLRHTEELAVKPVDWMPWKYRATLERNPSNPH